jgi:hypothetical protein
VLKLKEKKLCNYPIQKTHSAKKLKLKLFHATDYIKQIFEIMTQENVVFYSLETRGARIHAQSGVEGDSVHIYGGQRSGLRLYDVTENTKKN